MKCVICRVGKVAKGTTTVTLEKDGLVVVFKQVPARVCDQCGEYYLDEKVAARLQSLALAARERGAEVEILRYAA